MNKNDQPYGNTFNKYHSKNPFVRNLMTRFLRCLNECLLAVDAKSVLEVGCGEGYILSHVQEILKTQSLEGLDISVDGIKKAQDQFPDIHFKVGDATHLPYDNNQFEIIIACEVLEHISDFETALTEIRRVGASSFIFSVPNEPIWRILNFCRLKYMKDFGNTPGHVNHWNRHSFTALLEKNRFIPQKVLTPFPWIMFLCQKQE